MSEELKQLLEHMTWADALIWRTILELPGAAEDARIRQLIGHTHVVQWAYLQLWRKEPLELPDASAFADSQWLYQWGRQYHEEMRAFIATVTPALLDEAIRFPWAQQLVERFGTVHDADVRQSMLQIASHTTYHRGQINTRIRELGGEPPLTDFVAWVWRGRPSPEWI